MRFSTVFVLQVLLVTSCGRYDETSHLIVGTWQRDSSVSPRMAILADGGFTTSFESTNHTVDLTYQGTWQIKDRELMLTSTNVAGSVLHEPVGSIDRLRIIELDSHHMTLEYQAASNYVATNTYFKRP